MLLPIVALIITAANLFWFGSLTTVASSSLVWLAVMNQVIAALLALWGLIRFRDRRTRPNYEIGKPRIWTLPHALAVLALVAALGATLLPLARLWGW